MRIVDIKTYLADCLLPKVDVASMAHALEVRAPLLDHDVLRFALSLPDDLVSRRGQGKPVLRALLARYLPQELFDRRKQGFTLPLAEWFKRELLSTIKNLPRSEPLMATGWFRPDGVSALIAEHINGRRDHTQRLYNLLILEEWLRQN
jgi:asparagine synthase (glutamine-hydrolysing)